MRVHIVGIGGTFMAGVAVIAQQMGYVVSGSDEHVYPPMSDVLQNAGIEVQTGYEAVSVDPNCVDCVVVGNVISRGNPLLEIILDLGIPYYSGAEFLFEHVLRHKKVLAVAGTHGKSTTSALLCWMLHTAGLNPGYLIGAVPKNFSSSAAVNSSSYFVIEADEYDTAFFDKRPKFMHYRPDTLIINNIEFDHADIYTDLAAIEKQFAYLLRTVPASGSVVHQHDDSTRRVLAQGYWSNLVSFGSQSGDWSAKNLSDGGRQFDLYHQDRLLGTVTWSQRGEYNVNNALAASAAAHCAGVGYDAILSALGSFQGVTCRMDEMLTVNQVTYLRDFAHHPTAIRAAIKAVASSGQSVHVVLFVGSRTLQRHVDLSSLAASLGEATRVTLILNDDIRWSPAELVSLAETQIDVVNSQEEAAEFCLASVSARSTVLVLSNKDTSAFQRTLCASKKSIDTV